MIDYKTTIIVPVYNMEIYLRKCIDSILTQSYQNFELILINDGSTDSSKDIIDEYASKDKRIVAIHKNNGGIGSAYKVAFEVMSGDYVLFVDSDDWLELNAVESLIKLAVDNDADMVHFGMLVVDNNNNIIERVNTYNGIVNGVDNILNLHFQILKHPSLCRLFKRSLFDKTELYDQNIGIDEMLIVQLLSNCNKAVYVENVYYYALARTVSVSRIQYSKKKINEGIRVYQFICDFIEAHNKSFSSYLDVKYLNYLLPVYEVSRADKEIRNSEEYNSIKHDIIYYYHKSKESEEFKRQSKFFKLMIQILVLYPPIYDIIKSFLKQLFALRRKFIVRK